MCNRTTYMTEKTPWFFITHSWSSTMCENALRLIRETDRARTCSAKWHSCGYGRSYWHKVNEMLPSFTIYGH